MWLSSVNSAVYVSSVMGSFMLYDLSLVLCQCHAVFATILRGLVIWNTGNKNLIMSTVSQVTHVTRGTVATDTVSQQCL